jgi:hypothetical protein
MLIDIAAQQSHNAEAIEHAEMLFAPGQARMPAPLAAALRAAINAWTRGDEDTALEPLREASHWRRIWRTY